MSWWADTATINPHKARLANTLARDVAEGGVRVITCAIGLGSCTIDALIRRTATSTTTCAALSFHRDQRAFTEAGVRGGVVVGPRVETRTGWVPTKQARTKEE